MTKKKPPSVIFEEGCFDEMLDLTQEQMDALIEGIIQLIETGEIIENAKLVDDLPEEEQAEIIDMLTRKKLNTRH
jgi:uncharacterized protein YjgD (DUF1641 family)